MLRNAYKNKIEMVQRRAARYVCNNYNREACVSTMIKHLHWRSLQQRRTDIRLVMFYKTLHGIVTLDLFPQLIPLVRPSRHTLSALRGPGFGSKPGPARSPRAGPGRAGPLHNFAGRAGPGLGLHTAGPGRAWAENNLTHIGLGPGLGLV